MRQSVITTGALAAGLALGGALVVGAADGPELIHACVDDKTGEVRIAASPDECRTDKKESALTWNVQGRRGEPGPQGAPGPQGVPGQDGQDGEDGAPGADGQDGADGEPCTVTDDGEGTISLTCPDGSQASWAGTTTLPPQDPPTGPDGAVVGVTLHLDSDEWARLEDTTGDGTLGAGDRLTISALPTGVCDITTASNGTYTIDVYAELPATNGAATDPGTAYLVGYQGINIFGDTEERILGLVDGFIPIGFTRPQDGLNVGLTADGQAQFQSQEGIDGYFYSYAEALPTYGLNSPGSQPCGPGELRVEVERADAVEN